MVFGFSFFLLPEQASTTAERVDPLFWFLMIVTGFMTLLIAALILFFGFKYRRRPGDLAPLKIKESGSLELFWTVVPLILFMVMFFWGARVFFYAVRPPDRAIEIYVVGKQWMWKIQHPQGQREINELHMPVGQPVKLILTSEDVIHDFFVPAFRTKIDVLPNRYVHTWFHATKTGRYRFFCSQYCGTGHSTMIGEVVVMEPADYQKWLNDGAEGSMALDGRKVFLEYQCVACHSADSFARAPILEDLYQRSIPLQSGRTVLADDNYFLESILDPGAKIVAGYENIMPPYKGQIPQEQLVALVAYLKSLSPGQTPRRIDQAPVPVSQPGSEVAPSDLPGTKPSGPASPGDAKTSSKSDGEKPPAAPPSAGNAPSAATEKESASPAIPPDKPSQSEEPPAKPAEPTSTTPAEQKPAPVERRP